MTIRHRLRRLEAHAARREQEAIEDLPPAAKWARLMGLVLRILERTGAPQQQQAHIRECIATLAPAVRSDGPSLNSACNRFLIPVAQARHFGGPIPMACLRRDHVEGLREAIRADGAVGNPPTGANLVEPGA
jgi:hypothetical protein